MFVTRPTLVTPPAEPVVSLADAKEILDIGFADKDDEIEALVKAATGHLDGFSGILGRCLVNQEWSINVSDWPSARLVLPFPDVSSVELTYLDVADLEQTVSTSQYELVEAAAGTELWFQDAFARPLLSASAQNPITVTMTAGYGAAANVPTPIVTVIKMLVRLWFNPEKSASATAVQSAVDAMVAPHRRVGF